MERTDTALVRIEAFFFAKRDPDRDGRWRAEGPVILDKRFMEDEELHRLLLDHLHWSYPDFAEVEDLTRGTVEWRSENGYTEETARLCAEWYCKQMGEWAMNCVEVERWEQEHYRKYGSRVWKRPEKRGEYYFG